MCTSRRIAQVDGVDGNHDRVGCGWLGGFAAAEAVVWVVMGLFGRSSTLWVLVTTLVVAVVFFMIYGATRVLRGHDL